MKIKVGLFSIWKIIDKNNQFEWKKIRKFLGTVYCEKCETKGSHIQSVYDLCNPANSVFSCGASLHLNLYQPCSRQTIKIFFVKMDTQWPLSNPTRQANTNKIFIELKQPFLSLE
jgi:hypothetical protein